MGTAGNRIGYKVFSFNTTVRNPKRNIEFLEVFKSYDGIAMSDDRALEFFGELIKRRIYVPLVVNDRNTKLKILKEENLTKEEVKILIEDNPQKTGIYGRVKTQLRALKDLGFLKFEDSEKKGCVFITKLGQQLLNKEADATIVYLKAMVGTQGRSPIRTTIKNESCPFLNTLFVIKGVNAAMAKNGKKPRGILYHEFAVFVLSMKDNNYQNAIKNILNYRQRFSKKSDKTSFSAEEKEYLEAFLKRNKILPLKWNSLVKDYPDEVFRKFEMTGLLRKHGFGKNLYIDFWGHNKEKISQLLKYYKNYSWKRFSLQDDYYEYMSNIKIPWELDKKAFGKIIEDKSKILKISVPENLSLSEKEQFLDNVAARKILKSAILKYKEHELIKELKILSGTIKEKSKFDDIPEPLRLEFLLALFVGKKFGIEGLVSNLKYNADGFPLSYAPGGKSDLLFLTPTRCFVLEATMIRDRVQMLNSETTNIVRHVKDEQSRHSKIEFRTMLIAPRIHIDVARFFKYQVVEEKMAMLPYSIEKSCAWLKFNKNIDECAASFDKDVEFFKNKFDDFIEEINSFVLD